MHWYSADMLKERKTAAKKKAIESCSASAASVARQLTADVPIS